MIKIASLLIEFINDFIAHTLQQTLREHAQNSPRNIETFLNRTVLELTLLQKLPLELIQKVEINLIIGRKSIFSDNLLNILNFLRQCIAIIQLITNVLVVLAGHSFTNGRLHQP